MLSETSILDDIINTKSPKSRWFGFFIALACVYMVLVAIEFWLDAKKPQHAEFSWSIYIVVVIVPAMGTFFFCLNKKIGWILNALYFGFLCLVSFSSFIVTLFSKAYNSDKKIDIENFILLITSSLLVILLCEGSNRRYFKIGRTLFIICSTIVIALATTFVYFVIIKK